MRMLEYGATEIVAGKLYVLGGAVRNDNRISWVPPNTPGWLPINCYLLLSEGSAMLIDTGPACHRQQLLLQLKSLVLPNVPLSIIVTRAEADCIGNLDAVVRNFNVEGVFTGGVQNPFDFIDDALENIVEDAYDEDTVEALTGRRLERKEEGEPIELGGDRRLYVYAAPLRILQTFWLYDDGTSALFTSDFFGHNMMTDQVLARVLDDESNASDAPATVETVRSHMYTKFGWMKIADRETLAAKLGGFFAGRDVRILGPSHGRVLSGAGVIRRELNVVGQALWGGNIDEVSASRSS
jgi:flavorubredoxin